MQSGKPAAAAARKPSAGAAAAKNKTPKKKTTPEKPKAPAAAPAATLPPGSAWGNPSRTAAIASGSSTNSKGSAPPGFGAPAVALAPRSGFSNEHQRLLRHRALFAFRFLVGKAVDVELVGGARYAGVLDCIDPDDFSVVLKNTRRLTESAEPFESGSTAIFKRQQLAHLSADGVVNYTEGAFPSAVAASAGFRTDTEISGSKTEHLFGRELQVASSWLDPSLDTGELEESHRRSSKSGWNQFEANEKLFGVVSSFDENLYTTKLDKTKLSAAQSREAERLAQEIERQTSGNFHLQEERGQRVQDDGLDEEARYSSVDRSKGAPPAPGPRGPSAYLPPALRNAQRQTSGGAKTKSDQSAKPATPSPPSSSTPAAAPAAPKAAPDVKPAADAAPAKPLSFSDVIKGRAATPAASPSPPASTTTPQAPPPAPSSATQQEPVAEPKKAETAPLKAPTTNGKEAAKESKKAKAGEAAAKKTADSKQTTAAKERKEDGSSSQKSKAGEKAGEADAKTAESKADDAKSAAAPKKKGLNPNAKEFKLSATAAEFTPRFTPPAAYPAGGMYQPPSQQQMPYQPMGVPGYGPGPEEWMYDGMGMPMEDGIEFMGAPYGGYGMPMAPNGMMPMYPPMMPQQNVRMGGGGHRGHPQQPYNPRGYYNGGYAGGAYPAGGRMPGGSGPQPPLPREPSPGDGDVPAEEAVGDSSKKPSSPTKASKK